MASHPAVLEAVMEGLGNYGLNVAASRKTTGNHPVYHQLETALQRFFGAEKAVLTSNGYLSNLVLLQGIQLGVDVVLMDEKGHGSLLDAAAVAELRVVKFKHRDAADLASKLGRYRGKRVLVATDGVFSHDGRVAPLVEYLALLPPDGRLLVDDSHGAGVLGDRGRGTLEYCGITDDRTIQTITLSKAFGVYGGAVLCDAETRTGIMTRSRIFVGNTPMPLPLAYGALKAVELLKNPHYRKHLQSHIKRLKTGCSLSETWPGISPVIGVAPHNPAGAKELGRALRKENVFPSFIKYPGGAAEGYFRFALSSEHSTEQIDALARALKEAKETTTM
ncbi:MAG: aminotransferase class I/II-fold pyridoxal phosphate-dependent enzyme [Verrucomicrobiales bacterium]